MAGEMKNGRQLPVTGSYLQPWIHLAEEKEWYLLDEVIFRHGQTW